MVNIRDLFDDAKCFDTIRDMRWPDGVTRPRCSSDPVIKNGRDDTQPPANATDAFLERAADAGVGHMTQSRLQRSDHRGVLKELSVVARVRQRTWWEVDRDEELRHVEAGLFAADG